MLFRVDAGRVSEDEGKDRLVSKSLNWQERNPVQLADKGWKRKGKKAKRRNN
jgi:hypothetical protein